MQKTDQTPWASGPGEILRHGLDLLRKDTDTNRRLAMISIDNAVELMIKTYLGLPKRITGLSITRKEFQEISESFPLLLDALEKHAAEKLDGVDLGAIEWYHRLRNQLYHQGNGLTVERDKVEVYAELANLLFKNFFGQTLVEHVTADSETLGEFLAAWLEIENGLRELADTVSLIGFRPRGMLDVIRSLKSGHIIPDELLREVNELRRIRNDVVHGVTRPKDVLTPDLLRRAKRLAELLSERESEPPSLAGSGSG